MLLTVGAWPNICRHYSLLAASLTTDYLLRTRQCFTSEKCFGGATTMHSCEAAYGAKSNFSTDIHCREITTKQHELMNTFLWDVQVASPNAIRIFLGYPQCRSVLHPAISPPPTPQRALSASRPPPPACHVHLHALNATWISYNTANVTDQWDTRIYGQAWHRAMIPYKQLRESSSAKWDQCEGHHTYDTLADLELQLLLNAFLV